MEEYNFTLTNDPAGLERLQSQIQALLQASGVRLSVISAINVAMGEWLENIIQYAYEDGGTHEIGVRCTVGPPEIRVQVIDDGRPFNPCDYPALEVKEASSQGAYAGRGIHLIRHLMDEVRHERKDGKNILVLTKRVA